VFIALCVVLGLLIGSFLNVVIHRVPIMMDNELRAECAALAGGEAHAQPRYNIVTPRSACPNCKAPITALQNIPVLSWLALRGKCASCKTPISARYPLVELATGLLSGFIAWRYGFGVPGLAALAFTWLLIALTMIAIFLIAVPSPV
jgi:leader peptidase (prepilin peptidase)/N-methyltransferase